MARKVLACVIALTVPVVAYVTLGAILRFDPSPMFWSGAFTYSMMGSLLVGTALATFLSTRIARRPAPALFALVFPLIVAYDWWKVGDPTIVVLGIIASGALGFVLGTFLGSRTRFDVRIGEPAA